MIHGVDISGWQDGVRADEIEGDFVIVKATEGLQGTVYNPAYREMADDTLRSGKLLGFYHYANGADPIAEADSFLSSVADYRGRAVLALDWEGQGNQLFLSGQDAEWCKRFLDHVSDAWECTPILYTDKDATNAVDWSIVARDYPLWGAEYADMERVFGYQTDPWQSGRPWGAWGERPLIFQYTSALVLEHNGGIAEFDGNLMYGDRDDWLELCGGTAPTGLHGWAKSLEECRDAADYAYCTCAVYSCGYSQDDRENLTFDLLRKGEAETDCSYGVNTWLHWGKLLDELIGFHTAIEIDYLTGKGFTLLPATVAPRRNDVLWRQGHTALYIGDGMQAEALWSEDHSYDGAPGDQTGGETIVREYPAGGWEYILRPPAKEEIEDLEDEMICVFRPNGDEKQSLCYYDGSKVHPIDHPDELESVRMVYKQTHNGKDIPIFDLGAPTAPYATRFINLIQRDW